VRRLARAMDVAAALDADDAVADELKCDLLALYHTFADEDRLAYSHAEGLEDDDAMIRITFDASPRAAASRTDDVYVKATIELDVRNDGSYPASSSVRVRVIDDRGLSDARAAALTSTLADVAARCRASHEYALTLICTTAREVMDQCNAPYGTCAFCCEDMRGAREGCGRVDMCWHAFHAKCFSTWYAWREREIEEELARAKEYPRGSEEAMKIEAQAVHLCPVCRAVVSKEDAEKFNARAGRRVEEEDEEEEFPSSSSSKRELSRALNADARSILENLRVKFRDGLRVQDGKGGIIDERASGGGVVIDQSTTFTRPTPSVAAATGSGSIVDPPPVRSTHAAARRPRKDSSWLARAAAHSAKTLADGESVERPTTQKSSASGTTPRGRGRGRGGEKLATANPQPRS